MNGYAVAVVALVVFIIILIIVLARYMSVLVDLTDAVESSPTGCKDYIKQKM